MGFGSGRYGARSTFVRYERLVSFAAYYVLVMRLSDVYVMLNSQLLLVVIDLAYDIYSEFSLLCRNGPLSITNSILCSITDSLLRQMLNWLKASGLVATFQKETDQLVEISFAKKRNSLTV